MKTPNLVRMGPGTRAMLVGIAAFAVYSFATKPAEPRRLYYQADSKGRLQASETPPRKAMPTPALWKPEPAALLERSATLQLSNAQRSKIESISRLWHKEKLNIEDRMNLVARAAEAAPQSSVPALKEKLTDYSELSRRYDAERGRYWAEALLALEPNQVAILDRERRR